MNGLGKYEFNQDDFHLLYENRLENMKNRYYQAKIKYKENDYKFRSIILPMKTILTIIYYGEIDAYEHKKIFPGLTEKQIEDVMQRIWVDVDNVHNYLYRLTRLKYLIRSHYKSPSKTSKFYYQLNPDRFHCHKGEYVLYNTVNKKPFLMIGSCPTYLLCNCSPDVCVLFEKIREYISSIVKIPLIGLDHLPFFEYYKNKIQEWKYDAKQLPSYTLNLKKILEKYEYSSSIVDKLYDQEIIYYWKQIQLFMEKDEAEIQNVLWQMTKNIKTKFSNDIEDYEYNNDDLSSEISNKTDITSDPTNGRGLFPSMSNIMQVILFGMKIAQNMKKEFSGLTVYQIEDVLEQCPVSKDITSDTIYRLLRLSYLEENYYQQKSKKTKTRFYFLNPARFPCHLGSYVSYNPNDLNQQLLLSHCNCHISCNLSISSCKLLQVIQDQINSIIYPIEARSDPPFGDNRINWNILPFVQYLQTMFKQWNDEDESIEYYFELVYNLLGNQKYNPEDSDPMYSDLINAEIIYYGKKLSQNLSLKEKQDLRNEIIDLISIKKEKSRKHYNKQSKEEIKQKKEFREILLKILLETPETKKPPITQALQSYK